MKKSYCTCDVFTATRFGGNQLAVVLDGQGLSTEQMQTIAREFNYSETTFVLPPKNAAHTAQVRIFTPSAEMPFAGHPTVGTAFVLATLGMIGPDVTDIVFEENLGPVPVKIERSGGSVARCTLTAPKNPYAAAFDLSRADAAQLLGIAGPQLHAALPMAALSTGSELLIVPLKDRAALQACRLNTAAWDRASATTQHQQFYPCAIDAGAKTAYVRMFAPAHGVLEDPATGSAAATFAGYLAQHIDTQDGEHAWTVIQGVEMGRPSELLLNYTRAGGLATDVRVGGSAVMVMRGELSL
jgi:trans-2,3-dihydro-3-hydroxyanthranilate isomerase